jgi:hypothetical protein
VLAGEVLVLPDARSVWHHEDLPRLEVLAGHLVCVFSFLWPY